MIRQVNRACSSFFWHSNDSSSKGARIGWNSDCKPKSEGGLGLQDLETWNVARVLRNLWDIIICAGCLWVAWIGAYVLKGDSIWQVETKQNCSWNIRELLKLRELAGTFIEMRNEHAVLKLKGGKFFVSALLRLAWRVYYIFSGRKEI